MIDPVITSEIREILDRLLTEGVALRKDKLNEQMKAFRERFSPEVLNGLDGEQLLNRMHGGIEECQGSVSKLELCQGSVSKLEL